MNREELNKLISNYESKWGKLGHTNIMRPELNHSGINNKEEKQMSNMTNDLIKFRQKAFEGKRKNSLAHKATLDITEMNELNYEQLLESRTLIHAANYKYYEKIDLPNGDVRYFYTKEEWDAYQNKKKSTREEAMKEAHKKQHQLNTAHDMANNAAGVVSNALNAASTLKARQEAKQTIKPNDERWKNMQGDTVKQYAQIARESTPAAAAKEFMKEDAVTEFLDVVEEGFKNGKLRYENGYLVADDEGIGNNLDSTSANIQKWANWIGKESGNGRKVQDELEKLIGNDIEKLYNKYNRKTESQGQKLVQHDAFVDSEELMDEYSVFMEKVKRGKERNRLAHSTVISPAELNARYEEELTSHGILIHAGEYRPSGTNAYVAKIDDFYGQGKPRYFYTQEEWDAYQRNAKGASQAGADRANTNNAAQMEKQKKSMAETYRKNAEAAANAGARNVGTTTKSKNEENYLWKASAKARDNGNNELFNKVHEMYDEALYEASGEKPAYVLQSNGTKYKDHGQRSKLNAKAVNDPEFKNKVVEIWKKKLSKDDWDALEKLQKNPYGRQSSDNQSGSAKQGEAEGKAYEEYQKQQKEKLAKERAEISRKNDSGRDAAMKAGQKSEQDRQKLEEAKKNVNKEIDELRNNANDNVYDAKDLSNALKRNLNQDKIDDIGSELGGILTEYYKVVDNNDDSDEGFKLKKKAWDNYFEKRDKIFEKYGIEFNSPEYIKALKVSEEIEKEYEKKHKYDSSADAKIKKNIKEQEYNKNNTAKHSALDELNDFKVRVALGKEKNRLAHSRMISLTELQHAASGRYGAASGTNKYYAKLDDFYGKGKPRYFYSKAEWDAYQNNMKGAQNADRQKNDQSYRDQNKSFEENRRKNEEAAIGREKEQQAQSYTVKKALEENRRKNEGYAQNAEKDRSKSIISQMRDELKNAPTDIKDAPKPEDKPEITTKVENKVTQETKQENRNIEQEATDYAVNVINAIVEDETVQAYFNNACWHNVFGDSEGQMKEWNQIYDTEIAPRVDATINEAYQLYGPEYAAMLDQQIANLYMQMQNEYTTAYLSQRMALYGY